jgi:hypothetical protein
MTLTDWSWILSILKTDGRSIDVDRYATLYTEFQCRINRFYVRPSLVFPQKYTEFLYIETLRVGTHTHTHVVFYDYNFSIIKTHVLFFLSQAWRPKRHRLGSFAWDKLNSNPPLLRSYYKIKNLFFGEWPILRTPKSSSLPVGVI